jgi:hypothetical protein
VLREVSMQKVALADGTDNQIWISKSDTYNRLRQTNTGVELYHTNKVTALFIPWHRVLHIETVYKSVQP